MSVISDLEVLAAGPANPASPPLDSPIEGHQATGGSGHKNASGHAATSLEAHTIPPALTQTHLNQEPGETSEVGRHAELSVAPAPLPASSASLPRWARKAAEPALGVWFDRIRQRAHKASAMHSSNTKTMQYVQTHAQHKQLHQQATPRSPIRSNVCRGLCRLW